MTTKELLKKVYLTGLNIYPLLYRLKQKKLKDKHEQIPEPVLIEACKLYLATPKGWAWMLKVINILWEQYKEPTQITDERVRDLIAGIKT